MIDIHCHILHDIDDGPYNIEESIEMAKIAHLDGITSIVATPHIKDTLIPPEIIQDRIDKLQSRLYQENVPVRILKGADVNVGIPPAFLNDYTINGTKYILFEFPHTHMPANARDLIFKAIIRGLHPIITHPERNPSVIKNPNLIVDLADSNTFIQITAGSLIGDFGPYAKHCAIHLLRLGVVHFIASDAHSSTWRKPVLSDGVKVAEKIVGTDAVYRMVMTNPHFVINGSPLNVS